MRNYDYWSNFTRSGKIDDYLSYIACTSEKCMEEEGTSPRIEEGEYRAGINYRDGNGPISHAGWRL